MPRKGLYSDLVKDPSFAARQAWNRIKSRINAASRGDEGYGAYSGVEIRMSREEFLVWADEEYKKWMSDNPGVTPSLDRKDSRGHYQIGNLQLLSRRDNAKKSLANKHLHRGIGYGMKICGKCKEVKDFGSFYKIKSGSFGLDGWCKSCRLSWARLLRKTELGKRQQAARKAVGRALKSGRITKPEHCQDTSGCLRTDIEAHHRGGYSKERWLDVEWLCHSHHGVKNHSKISL